MTQKFESFWSTLRRADKGVCHKFSKKHLQRYIDQFAGNHNVRDCDTIAQIAAVVEGFVGKRLMYRNQISGIIYLTEIRSETIGVETEM